MRLARVFLLALLVVAVPAIAKPDPDRREQRIAFARGATEATVKGTIAGRRYTDHLVRALGGQELGVRLEASNAMAAYVVLGPGDETFEAGRFDASAGIAKLPVDGTYTVRVFLERAAARRGESSTYALRVSVTGTPGPVAFAKQLEKDGIGFAVSAPNTPEKNEVRVAPTGLEIRNDPVSWAARGRVVDADVGDLDGDGSPEVYVFVRGEGGRLSLVAWSANKRKSLSMIHLPSLEDIPGAAAGYRGGDFMMLSGDHLTHTFPIHGADGKPTGKRRSIEYKLAPGEASWQLVPGKFAEF